MAERRVLIRAFIAESLRLLEAPAFGSSAMRCRELMAGIAYQLAWTDLPPDEEIEGELMSRGLVVRMAPTMEDDDAEG